MTIKKSPQWINYKEQKPPLNETVLVVLGNIKTHYPVTNAVFLGCRISENDFIIFNLAPDFPGIATYWMPLIDVRDLAMEKLN